MDYFSRHIFRSLLPYSMSRQTRLIVTLVLALIVSLIWYCEKKIETPPPPKAAQTHASSDCCQLSAATGLKEGMGRLVVAFPDSAVPKGTRVAVLKDGKEAQAGHGSQSFELLSGTYDVTISGKRVPTVTVQPSHDTMVKVGVLHISAGKDTRGTVLDGGKEIGSGHGNQVIDLPPDPYDLKIAGQTERVTISEGKITDL